MDREGQELLSARKSPARSCRLSPYWGLWTLLGQQHGEDLGSGGGACLASAGPIPCTAGETPRGPPGT